jgi:hypothetical protein
MATALYRAQNFGDGFRALFGAQIAFPMDADADRVGFQVAPSDYEHGVHCHLFGSLNFAVDLIETKVDAEPV